MVDPKDLLAAEREAYRRHKERQWQEPEPVRVEIIPKAKLHDGRVCAECKGPLTSEDFKYCSDKCRRKVAEKRND